MLGLRPITDQEHSKPTNAHFPQVGNMSFEDVVVKVTDVITGILLLINIYRKYTCSTYGLWIRDECSTLCVLK